MKKRALLSAIALCFAAAGCDSQKAAEPPKPKAEAAVTALPPEAPKAAAASANQDAKPMADNMAQASPKADTKKAEPPSNRKIRRGTKGCGNGNCVVHIKDVKPGAKCTATITPWDLSVAGQKETITWHVNGGWNFAPNGIDLPAGGGQFGVGQGAGTDKWQVVDKNDDDQKYKYVVNLVNGGQKCAIDPSIVNGAETVE